MAGTAHGPLWLPAPPPPSGPGWSWDLGHVRDLPRVRGELRAHLADARDHARPAARADEDTAEQVVLAFDEMASNALRHGGGDVTAAVRPSAGHWLVEVCDAAPDRAPAPAVDRDPSQGGLGLYLIAELAVDHGWQTEDGHKSVWAVLPGAGLPG